MLYNFWWIIVKLNNFSVKLFFLLLRTSCKPLKDSLRYPDPTLKNTAIERWLKGQTSHIIILQSIYSKVEWEFKYQEALGNLSDLLSHAPEIS